MQYTQLKAKDDRRLQKQGIQVNWTGDEASSIKIGQIHIRKDGYSGLIVEEEIHTYPEVGYRYTYEHPDTGERKILFGDDSLKERERLEAYGFMCVENKHGTFTFNNDGEMVVDPESDSKIPF